LKYFIQDEEDELLYYDENVALIITDDKFIFLSRDEHIMYILLFSFPSVLGGNTYEI